jgi:hypothetical protein
LLLHNGGQPSPSLIDIHGAHFGGADVLVFYGIDARIESSDLLWNWETLDGCKEYLLLPIAGDSFGHTFALVLAKDDYGHVYYFDSGEIPPRPYLVAHDFNDFLGKIREPTPDELAVDVEQ